MEFALYKFIVIIRTFRIFWKLFLEMFVPFVPISKVSEFLMELKVPPVSEQVTKISILNIGMV